MNAINYSLYQNNYFNTLEYITNKVIVKQGNWIRMIIQKKKNLFESIHMPFVLVK